MIFHMKYRIDEKQKLAASLCVLSHTILQMWKEAEVYYLERYMQ